MIIITVKIPKHQRLKEKILISKPALNYQILRLRQLQPIQGAGWGLGGEGQGRGAQATDSQIKGSKNLLLMSVLSLSLSPPSAKFEPPPEGQSLSQVYHVLILSCLGGQSGQPIKPGGRGNGELRTHPLPPRTCFPTTSNSEMTISTPTLETGQFPVTRKP